MISTAQAAQYLDQQLGVAVTSFVLDAAVVTVGEAEPAMDAAGYSASKKVLIQSMAVALVAGADSGRKISSQTAPSGASRSFKYADKALTLMRRTLANLDTAGTVTEIVGPDPAGSTMFMVVC